MNLTSVACLLVGLLVGAVVTGLALRARYAAVLASSTTTAALLRDRVGELERAAAADQATLAALAPLRETLSAVERQVGILERERATQFGQLGERLTEVNVSTAALRDQTAALVGSLNASTVRGTWGENQLRRILEHSGMLSRCDFEEQVSTVTSDERVIRPDVVVRLPGDKRLVIDAKAPLRAFLAAHAEGVTAQEQARLLRQHALTVRTHVDGLASKEYWSGFVNSPELVVCFIPADAVLAAALAADPNLFDDAQANRVVLACPSTLLALLRTVAFTWQQDALVAHAQELFALGGELYSRLGTLGGHVTKLGSSLRRSVESYNAFVGSLETRVLVTARRFHDMQLAQSAPPTLAPLEVSPRAISAAELLEPLTNGEDPGRSPNLDARPEARHAPPTIRLLQA